MRNIQGKDNIFWIELCLAGPSDRCEIGVAATGYESRLVRLQVTVRKPWCPAKGPNHSRSDVKDQITMGV